MDATITVCLFKGGLAESAGERVDYYDSIRIMRELMDDRMFPLTLEGLDAAMRELGR